MSVMTDTSILGRVLWSELLTTDVEAAKRFYTAVVAWTVTPFRSSPDQYEMWTRADNASIGGVMKIPQGMNFPPHWGIYIGVLNLDEAVSKIERLGGSALSPVIDVPEVGRMRTMKDPQGAAFSVYEPSSAPQRPEQAPEVGDLSWMELYTTDVDAALKFYTDLFGWHPTEATDMGAMGKYQMFGRAFPLGGMMKKPKEMEQAPPHWGLYFRVPDVHAAADRVKANGGKVLNGPMEVPGGDWIINCQDPQGAFFSLHHTKK
jgi:predicted enzyme related to lactoylglutathione lyase